MGEFPIVERKNWGKCNFCFPCVFFSLLAKIQRVDSTDRRTCKYCLITTFWEKRHHLDQVPKVPQCTLADWYVMRECGEGTGEGEGGRGRRELDLLLITGDRAGARRSSTGLINAGDTSKSCLGGSFITMERAERSRRIERKGVVRSMAKGWLPCWCHKREEGGRRSRSKVVISKGGT